MKLKLTPLKFTAGTLIDAWANDFVKYEADSAIFAETHNVDKRCLLLRYSVTNGVATHSGVVGNFPTGEVKMWVKADYYDYCAATLKAMFQDAGMVLPIIEHDVEIVK